MQPSQALSSSCRDKNSFAFPAEPGHWNYVDAQHSGQLEMMKFRTGQLSCSAGLVVPANQKPSDTPLQGILLKGWLSS